MKNSDLDHKTAVAPDDLLEPVLGLINTDEKAALPRLDDLLEHYAGDPRLHFLRGSVLAGLERYPDARQAMQKAVDIAPDYLLARFQLGFLALTSGDAAGAQSIWRPLESLVAGHPLKLFVEGLQAMVANNFAQAIFLLETAISQNKEVPPLNGNMALLVRAMRDKLNVHGGAEAGESGVHFLLKQYSLKDTRH